MVNVANVYYIYICLKYRRAAGMLFSVRVDVVFNCMCLNRNFDTSDDFRKLYESRSRDRVNAADFSSAFSSRNK